MSFLSGFFSDKKKTEAQSSQTGTSQYGLTPQVQNYWSSIANLYNPASWSPVGADPYQTSAAANQAGYASGLTPSFNAATSIGQTGISTGDIARFQNPWEDQVVQNTLEDMRDADAQALAQSNAAAAKAGALGGSGAIVRRNLAEEGFQDARNKAITSLRSQGFNTAADLAAKSTGAQISGIGAASGVAGQQAGINQGQFGMGSQLWNQNWQNQLLPYQLAQQGAQTIGALTPYSGTTQSGTSTGTQTTTASPSPFSVGMNLFGAALAGGWKPFADGGRVDVEDTQPPNKDDPHARFRAAFDTISGLMEKSRGGSVMKPYAAGGPIGSWETTVTPASSFDTQKFGKGLQQMGQSSSPSMGDDTSLLSEQQRSLSTMLSGMRRARGGEVWDETGPQFEEPVTLSPYISHTPEGGWTSSKPWSPRHAESIDVVPLDKVERTPLSPPASRHLDRSLPRSVRTSNPGAMEYGDFARRHGAIGSDGRYAVFPDEEAGYKAMSDLLDIYGRRGQNTVASIIGGTPDNPDRSWAPRSVDNNSTDSYIAFVAKKLGIDPHAPLTPEQRQPLMRAMADYEAGRHGNIALAPSGASGAGRTAWVEPTAARGAVPVVKDAGTGGGWFSDGVWAGKPATPSQRLGMALMSIRGPMFEGPLNAVAHNLLQQNEARLRERQIDAQADQFAKQLAQQAGLAAGIVDGQPTLARRQYEEGAPARAADIRKTQAEIKALETKVDDPIAGFIADRLKALGSKVPPAVGATTPPAARDAPGGAKLIPQSFDGNAEPKIEQAVDRGEDPNLIKAQAVVGDAPVASRHVEIPGTKEIDTPIGRMPLAEARQLGGAMLISPKYKELGQAMMSAIERAEKTLTKEEAATNISQSAMSEVNKKEVNASEGLSRLVEVERLFKPKYQTWEEGLKNMGLSTWDSIGFLRDKMTDEQRKDLTEFTKFKATAVGALNDYIREITGAAMSAGEAERIRKGIIDVEKDSPTQFKAKLDQGIRLTQLALIRYAYTRKSGKPWSESGISLDQMERLVEEKTRALRDEVRRANPDAKPNQIDATVGRKLKEEFGI